MMRISLIIFLWIIYIVDGKHFHGGTITWTPINPYTNSSLITIIVKQSYEWDYPTINCTPNVLITSPNHVT